MSTATAQMVTDTCKVKKAGLHNQTITNMALVVDSYGASDIEQYLLGKQFQYRRVSIQEWLCRID